MSTPVMLDLCSGRGGAALGYKRSGFYVIGIDKEPMPGYLGDMFIQADILTFPLADLVEMTRAVFVHASPPCQLFSNLAAYQRETIEARYDDLVDPVRAMLTAIGLPFVIENVEAAPLVDPVMLCGTMFPGLRVIRHRYFEPHGFTLPRPPHVSRAEHPRCVRNGYLPTPEAPWMSVHGGKHSRAWQRAACEAMGLPEMAIEADADREQTRQGIRDISEAIPASYAQFVAGHVILDTQVYRRQAAA